MCRFPIVIETLIDDGVSQTLSNRSGILDSSKVNISGDETENGHWISWKELFGFQQ